MRPKYRYCLLDLDGTLTDPGIGITNSVMHALGKYDLKVKDRSELYFFIGPPLADSFRKYFDRFGIGAGQEEQAVAFYREYFKDKGVEIVYFPYTQGTSSTQIRNAIIAKANNNETGEKK